MLPSVRHNKEPHPFWPYIAERKFKDIKHIYSLRKTVVVIGSGSLFKKIKKMKPAKVLEERIRIPDYRKALIILRAGIKNQLRLI